MLKFLSLSILLALSSCGSSENIDETGVGVDSYKSKSSSDDYKKFFYSSKINCDINSFNDNALLQTNYPVIESADNHRIYTNHTLFIKKDGTFVLKYRESEYPDISKPNFKSLPQKRKLVTGFWGISEGKMSLSSTDINGSNPKLLAVGDLSDNYINFTYHRNIIGKGLSGLTISFQKRNSLNSLMPASLFCNNKIDKTGFEDVIISTDLLVHSDTPKVFKGNRNTVDESENHTYELSLYLFDTGEAYLHISFYDNNGLVDSIMQKFTFARTNNLLIYEINGVQSIIDIVSASKIKLDVSALKRSFRDREGNIIAFKIFTGGFYETLFAKQGSRTITELTWR